MQENELIADKAPTSGFLLLFRGKDWDEGLSDDELQKVLDRTTNWFNSLMQSGKVKGGQALAREGKTILPGSGGGVLRDGPFAESKEAIGGYLLLDVETMEEAVAIARTSPGLEHGISIDVRPVLEECPCFRRARQRLGLKAAA